jgi:hypothetical protein
MLFSAPMVRAILAGTKTQTRRIIKDPDRYGCLTGDCPHNRQTECDADMAVCCPNGCAGVQLWVRETWKTYYGLDHMKPSLIAPGAAVLYAAGGCSVKHPGVERWGKTRVSIFMPRWASRIQLEITAVRAQRLQDISNDDAKAEGVEQFIFHKPKEPMKVKSYAEQYRDLWDRLNAKRGFGWKENPWVWVITFKKL